MTDIELHRYGYTWVGMKQIDLDTACKLWDKGLVYKLYEDNTESLVVNSTEEMLKHCANGGKLGVEKTDKEVQEEICHLYNKVGDLSMLTYMANYYQNTNDYKLKHYINTMLQLNEYMLDTDIYVEERREMLNYMGYDYDESGYLIYVGKEKISNEYRSYIIFVLGRDLIKGIIPSENDLAYEICEKVADDFIDSEYDKNTKGIYECLEDYVKNSFYLKNGKITWKGTDINEI